VKEPRAPPAGWLTISALAVHRGVDKSAVSRRVTRLESMGLLSTRTQGRLKLVCVADFDRATAATVDSVRELNGGGASAHGRDAGVDVGLVLANEQALRASYDAQLKRMDLEERQGKLVEVDKVRRAIEGCSAELARKVNALPSRSDALASAFLKDGAAGLRAALRAEAHAMLKILADVAERFAEAGPVEDREMSGEEVAA
jgi:DNA-binding MarR family transcriptional regulator